MTRRDDSGRCSFCGRGEEVVGSLFSRGAGRICTSCVDAAVEVLEQKVPSTRQEGALERQIERHRRLSDLLLELALRRPVGMPARIVDALEKVTVSSRSLEAAVRRWAEGEEGSPESDPEARFAHVASKLVALLQPLRAWRATLPATVPAEQLHAINQALTALVTLARVLGDPSPEGSGRRR